MEICRAFELHLEDYAIRKGIRYNVIESKIYSNAHFHGLHYNDTSKATKHQKLKLGEQRTQSPKATFFLKVMMSKDEHKELTNVVARELERASQQLEKAVEKKEMKKEVKKGKKATKLAEIPTVKRPRT